MTPHAGAEQTVLLRDGIVDLDARRIWRRGGVSRLSRTEVEVLSLLARDVDGTVDRQELLVRALGHAPDSMSRAVDVCVSRLRSKLERDPAQPVHLITVHSQGYRLVPASRVEDLRSNVAPARSPLIGRAELLEQVRAALRSGPVALLGPAGVGKSRLAQELAHEAGRSWAPAGSWWVDLAEVRGLEDGVRAVAAVLDVDAETPGALEAMATRGPSLFVLDTCERCVDVAAHLARSLSAGAGVLLTSRVEVPGVRSVEIPPLPHDEAVALFFDRANEGRAALDPVIVGRVVDAVDRLPLAIELATARLSAMPLVRIEQELVHPLRLLRERGGASVEASVRWSWDALSEADRAALVQLSVFLAPVPDDAVQALIPTDAADRLLASRLVRRVTGGVVPWHAVREFAASNTDPEPWKAAAGRHAAWMSAYAERWLAGLWGPGFPESLARLEALDRDLEAAREHLAPEGRGAVVHARAEVAYEASGFRRVVAMVDAALPFLAPDDPHRVSIACLAASSVGKSGDWVEAEARGRAALSEARTPFERVGAAYVVCAAMLRCGRGEAARGLAEEALSWAGDDPVCRARALGASMLASVDGMALTARLEHARLALEAARDGQVERLLAPGTHNYAIALLREGRTAEAVSIFEETVVHAGRNRRMLGFAHMCLGMVHLHADPNGALDRAERALEAFRDGGCGDAEVTALSLRGLCRALVGDVVDALADHDEVYARSLGATDDSATSTRAIRAVSLALVGRSEAARAAFAEIRSDLARHLTFTEEDAEVLVRAWVEGEPVSTEAIARLERVGGNRLWLHAQILRASGRVGV